MQYPLTPRRRILLIAGTRPEAVKLAPVYRELRARADFDARLCVTGQHRSMLAQALEAFSIVPDYDLDVMRDGQDLFSLSSRCLDALGDLLRGDCGVGAWRPHCVVVQGDTTTTLTGAMSALYAGIPLAHVEAGLRSGDLARPFPEEANRRMVSRIASLHFAPTERAALALRNEGAPAASVYTTGNTVVDALLDARRRAPVWPQTNGRKLVLVTGHRRESLGEGFQRICKALDRIARRGDVEIVYPVHLNPQVHQPVHAILGGHQNIRLIEPLGYLPFVGLMEASSIILTDSGGVQEEAPTLCKPVLIMRDVTERPEAVEAGAARIVGSDPESIVAAANELLDDPSVYAKMSAAKNPFGDGRAAGRIADILAGFLEHGRDGNTPQDTEK